MRELKSNWATNNLKEYIYCLKEKRTDKNGVLGINAHFYQLEKVFISNNLQMESFFPNLKYIYISRKNHLEQAISFVRALQTNRWVSIEEEQQPPQFNLKKIEYHIEKIKMEELSWEQYFSQRNLSPFKITYEEFSQHYETILKQVLKFLEIDVPPNLEIPQPLLKKMSDNTTLEWKSAYMRQNNEQQVAKSTSKTC
jgi:trehalose 2-sulfotransferase